MRILRRISLLLLVLVSLAAITVQKADTPVDDDAGPTVLQTHTPPPPFFLRELRERMNAPLEVALVFGRSTGCSNADPLLIDTVARDAVKVNMPPKVLAATIAVESQCEPYAVSSRGALGLSQVMPKIWKNKFDFETVNLLNPQDNVRVGATIMAGLIHEHGLARGVQLYNGAGVGCETCDGGYSNKVLALAGR